jgi:hypothetical protein
MEIILAIQTIDPLHIKFAVFNSGGTKGFSNCNSNTTKSVRSRISSALIFYAALNDTKEYRLIEPGKYAWGVALRETVFRESKRRRRPKKMKVRRYG